MKEMKTKYDDLNNYIISLLQNVKIGRAHV